MNVPSMMVQVLTTITEHHRFGALMPLDFYQDADHGLDVTNKQ